MRQLINLPKDNKDKGDGIIPKSGPTVIPPTQSPKQEKNESKKIGGDAP